MTNVLNASLTRVVASVLFCAATLNAQQFIYTNDNQFNQGNTTTALKVGVNALKVINTYQTGGASAGGGYFALQAVSSAQTSTSRCLFVSNGGDSTIAAFTINLADGTLTPVTGSPFPYGVSGQQQFGIGLAVGRNRFVFAGNTAFNSISELKISSTCALRAVKTYLVPGSPDGMKVTPNGQFLIAAYLGQVDSFQINYSTGTLTELGPFSSQAVPAGLDISCDNSTVYFGDAGTITQVEVFSISPTGQLTEINNFTNSNGVNSNNALLSTDGTALYVSNTMSNQITTLGVGSNGSLTYVSTTTVNGSPLYVLNLAETVNGAGLFVSEDSSPEGLGYFSAHGTTISEKTGSPFSVVDNGSDVPSFTEVPGKVCL